VSACGRSSPEPLAGRLGGETPASVNTAHGFFLLIITRSPTFCTASFLRLAPLRLHFPRLTIALASRRQGELVALG
jgi:hypothetical protein